MTRNSRDVVAGEAGRSNGVLVKSESRVGVCAEQSDRTDTDFSADFGSAPRRAAGIPEEAAPVAGRDLKWHELGTHAGVDKREVIPYARTRKSFCATLECARSLRFEVRIDTSSSIRMISELCRCRRLERGGEVGVCGVSGGIAGDHSRDRADRLKGSSPGVVGI